MNSFYRKEHWENIYQNKNTNQLTWYQPKPIASLTFVKQFNLPKTAKIIDIGGGDSFFVDYMLNLGYQNITVLDISEQAIERAKKRLGDKAETVKWVIVDVIDFCPTTKYDLWHDRATFHFFTDKHEIKNYVMTIKKHLEPTGYLIVGAFSYQGPKKCSGIEIKQYSEQTMTNLLKRFFEKIKCIKVDHKTPFDTIQNFIFCSFKLIGTT